MNQPLDSFNSEYADMGKVADTSYSSYPYVQAQTIMPNDKADLLDKIKPDLIVEIIRHKLMGEELINGRWTAIPFLKDKALSFKGAWDLSTLMIGVSSQNTALSKLDDREIKNRALSLVKTAMYMCIRNWEEYGIKGVDQLYFVYEIIFSNSYITLKQNEGEGIRRMIVGTYSENKIMNDQQKPSAIAGLFRR